MKIKVPLTLTIFSIILFIIDFIKITFIEHSYKYYIVIHSLLRNIISLYGLFICMFIVLLSVWIGKKKINYQLITIPFISILGFKIYTFLVELFLNFKFTFNTLAYLIIIFNLIMILIYLNKKGNKYIFMINMLLFTGLLFYGVKNNLSIIINDLTILSYIPFLISIKKGNISNKKIEYKIIYNLLSLTGIFILIIMQKKYNLVIINSVGLPLLIISNILIYFNKKLSLLCSVLSFSALMAFQLIIIKSFDKHVLLFLDFSLVLIIYNYLFLIKNKIQLKV